MLRFLVIFFASLAILFTLELLGPVDRHVIEPFTGVIADICAWIIRHVDGRVIVEGKVIRSVGTGFAISIERGCNGIEAVIILVCAMLAFPASWKRKLAGIVIGFFAIQALNLVRIISLFYLGQWNRTWFDWFHLYLWQALIVLDALVVFLVWLRSLPRPAADTAPDGPVRTPQGGSPDGPINAARR
jgi:exosortase H (IPTLxxWG-CTERM-specific)